MDALLMELVAHNLAMLEIVIVFMLVNLDTA